jgi:GntR family transcriptional regulator / MocR family aminotransferase
MPKQGTIAVVLRPRAAGATLHSWLYEEIRTAIVERRLAPGLKLPARKMLARQYRVSIGTVTEAYARLAKLGYVEARQGSGTYVRAAPAASNPETAPPQPAPGPARSPRRTLSARGRLLAAQRFPRLSSNRSAAAFALDRQALDLFPLTVWNRLAAQRGRRGGSLELLAHGHPLGLPALRAALATYIRRARGVRCDADQVVVTSGTQHSLDLVARLLLDPGDEVWMEDPGYAPVTALLRAHDARVVGVPVDAHGLDSIAGRLRSPLARLAYVTPGCQFPLGVPMSHERRLQLLDWAGGAGAWIFEDDYDGLPRGDGRHQSALQSLDRAGCVIYSNSLNRMLFPSLRLGFLVLPPAFIEPAAAALAITQRYQAAADQATLTDFIAHGHLDRHIQRMRERYAERHEALIAAAGTELRGLLQFSDSQAAPQIVGWLPPGTNEAEAWRRAAARNIDAIALASLTIDRHMPPALVFGIGAGDARAMRTATKRLGRVLRVLAWQTKGASAIQNKVPVGINHGHGEVPRQVSDDASRQRNQSGVSDNYHNRDPPRTWHQ